MKNCCGSFQLMKTDFVAVKHSFTDLVLIYLFIQSQGDHSSYYNCLSSYVLSTAPCICTSALPLPHPPGAVVALLQQVVALLQLELPSSLPHALVALLPSPTYIDLDLSYLLHAACIALGEDSTCPKSSTSIPNSTLEPPLTQLISLLGFGLVVVATR